MCTGRTRTDDILAAIVYDPTAACELVPELGRLQHWQLRVAGIRAQLTAWQAGVVWAIYGYDRPTAAELAELQEVVKGLVIQARSYGDVPVLLAGDLSATLEECAFLKGLARDGWRDLDLHGGTVQRRAQDRPERRQPGFWPDGS